MEFESTTPALRKTAQNARFTVIHRQYAETDANGKCQPVLLILGDYGARPWLWGGYSQVVTGPITEEHWNRLAELTRAGVVFDDDSLFALGVCQRYDPAKHDSLPKFYSWCRGRTRQRSREGVTATERPRETADIPVDASLFDTVDAQDEADRIRELVGPVGWAVLQYRYGEGLSARATALKMGIPRTAVEFIEAEAKRLASSVRGAD